MKTNKNETIAHTLIFKFYKELEESLEKEKFDFINNKVVGVNSNNERLENLFTLTKWYIDEIIKGKENVDGETVLNIAKERESIISRMNANLICYTNAFEIYQDEKDLINSIISNLVNYSKEKY